MCSYLAHARLVLSIPLIVQLSGSRTLQAMSAVELSLRAAILLTRSRHGALWSFVLCAVIRLTRSLGTECR